VPHACFVRFVVADEVLERGFRSEAHSQRQTFSQLGQQKTDIFEQKAFDCCFPQIKAVIRRFSVERLAAVAAVLDGMVPIENLCRFRRKAEASAQLPFAPSAAHFPFEL